MVVVDVNAHGSSYPPPVQPQQSLQSAVRLNDFAFRHCCCCRCCCYHSSAMCLDTRYISQAVHTVVPPIVLAIVPQLLVNNCHLLWVLDNPTFRHPCCSFPACCCVCGYGYEYHLQVRHAMYGICSTCYISHPAYRALRSAVRLDRPAFGR